MDRRSGDRSTAVDLGDLTLIRSRINGRRFELIVNPEKAWLFSQGEDLPLDEIVEGFIIFENFSKGLKASVEDIKDAFGTNNERKIAEIMLQKGDLQISQEQRKQFLKEKRDEIIHYFVKHAVNPRTKAPHPASRIEKAMDDAGVRVDRNEETEEQVKRIMTQIQTILPIKIETATVEFVVPPKDTGPLYGYIQGSGEVVNESWGNDGTLTMLLRIPAGTVAGILEAISDKSKGRVRATVVERSD